MSILVMILVLPTIVALLFRADQKSFTSLHDKKKCSDVSSQWQVSQFGLSPTFALKSQ